MHPLRPCQTEQSVGLDPWAMMSHVVQAMKASLANFKVCCGRRLSASLIAKLK